jgi:hypothetical protein
VEGYAPVVPSGARMELSDVFLPVDATPKEATEQQRRAALDAEVGADAFIQRLRDAPPEQIKTHVQNNVTDLASARLFIGKLACAVANLLG